MSVYAQFGESGNKPQIASNLGWSEFGDWIESLGSDYPFLLQLWEHGASEDIKSLANELEEAIETESPAADVKSSAELFLQALHSNEDAEFVLTTQ